MPERQMECFFKNQERVSSFGDAVNECKKYGVWHTGSMNKNINSITALVSPLLDECQNKVEAQVVKVALAHRDDIGSIVDSLSRIIRKEMASLHNVEKFFKER
jgi:hypothetical protein